MMLPVLIILILAHGSVASPLALAIQPITAIGGKCKVLSFYSKSYILKLSSQWSPAHRYPRQSPPCLARSLQRQVWLLRKRRPMTRSQMTKLRFPVTGSISGIAGEGQIPVWGTNTVPPMREGLVAIVPRPQTSVTGPAPIETPAPLSAIPTVPESARSVVTRHGRPGNPAPEPQTSISGLAPVSAPPAPDSGSSNACKAHRGTYHCLLTECTICQFTWMSVYRITSSEWGISDCEASCCSCTYCSSRAFTKGSCCLTYSPARTTTE